jgi:hypothetical protein
MLFRPPMPFGLTCQEVARTDKPMTISKTAANTTRPNRILNAAASCLLATVITMPTAASTANGVTAKSHGRQRVMWKVSCDVSSMRLLLEGRTRGRLSVACSVHDSTGIKDLPRPTRAAGLYAAHNLPSARPSRAGILGLVVGLG